MSKEKQIEEMGEELEKAKIDAHTMIGSMNNGFGMWYAQALYNAGYRKQGEGEWKKKGNEKTCSRCKFIYYSNNDEWNYCPNCGAKMKDGAE